MTDPTHSQRSEPEDRPRADPSLPAFDPPGEFQDESLAPEVDHDLLRALVRRELTEETARGVYHLIHSFRSWNEAHAQILIEEFRRTHGATPPGVPPDNDGGV